MGSPEWLEGIYHEHAPSLFRFLIRLTGDEAETRDILQEIFIRLAKSPHLLQHVNRPRPYLMRMAHRIAIDRMRRDETRRHYHEQASVQAGETTISLAGSDETWRQRQLASFLATLPEEQRAVVLLKVWEEMTFAEIAGILETSPHTAASRYRYALDKLRAALRPFHEDLK